MGTTSDGRSSRYSRKKLLGRFGAGAAAAGAGGLLRTGDAAGDIGRRQQVYATPTGRFGRMFPGLPSFAPASKRVEDALRDLGKPGGILDAKTSSRRARCS
jgi:hypothetical protein